MDSSSVTTSNIPNPISSPHAAASELVLVALKSSLHGLTHSEAAARLELYGRNTLPQARPPGIATVFFRQFASPLIYVLVAAALFSLMIKEWSDAGFISAVLFINAVIGSIQEHSAQRAATALQELVRTRCRVLREGDSYEINAEELVPGDIVLLESGDKIPADLRLLVSHDLEVDESLLTGESLPVVKDGNIVLNEDIGLGDRVNMLFTGTLIGRGRARGVVVSTALNTVLGSIAADVLSKQPPKAPLQVRMDRFTHRVAIFVGIAALTMLGVAVSRGTPFAEMFLLVVALAVSVIPEGLPVALTVALAIGMRRMARRNVIVRRLLAVEALGSCTLIATDKTGTLTVNQLTARCIAFPNRDLWEISGEGIVPEGQILTPRGAPSIEERILLERLCQAAALTNEGFLGRIDSGWSHHGDAVDVAFLVMAHKAGVVKAEISNNFPEIATIPYESERLFSASLNDVNDRQCAFVKGALERLLPMCTTMASLGRDVAINHALIEQQAHALASGGYRVLALAAGEIELSPREIFTEEHLHGLALIGLVGIIDPLRIEVKAAVTACRQAGIEVAMITGDHPATAFAIARELGMAERADQLVSGPELSLALESGTIDQLTRDVRVFARVGPHQKLDIVQSLQRNGHFVAVSGDGANDAPALRAAQVGVAMGMSGTDVARETADLIITDDNFASIVAGVEEGRVAYANVRKVIFLLISTGAAELVLFTLALLTGMPLPLMAVHLLWLNLVTNGVQDVALAFEPGEGDELRHPPRSPREPIFNRLMMERVVISALVIGSVAFLAFQWLIARGFTLDEARNGTLLLMVLFENVHVLNCRSELRSVFRHNLLLNPILLIGTVVAQLVHIGAMYTPWIRDVLHIQPVTPQHWLVLLGLALTVLMVMELHKALRRWY
ncbi:MAG: HAD-IC family P-type ATPase [Proteobacteria bacterium]|jgi:magnesium-transporting ATPase (P-type)|nr:HAD-IC family P-type ATPase [Desulfocapsa sp.]MBU3945965.1 HAD-IC family P-type ATPase [Pseudomonadota bacterium]MBU3982067.1 HAD-IC family P-type ATPase [Pseudomonadota bacterium]MBU4028073.1 HAD-IC family P-type ATPase [Pseudomonadota bacterium]MBU4042975.1 HAD-IC family P-type ATPase [Pseudomonadota bacterium]